MLGTATATTEAPPIGKPNGAAGKNALPVAAAPTITQATHEAAKLNELHGLAIRIKAQEAVVEQKKIDLKTERGKWQQLVEQHLQLSLETTLPLRKESPNLFNQPTTVSSAKATDEAADKAAFDVATLAGIGISASLAEKLEADGIKNGADLQKWFAQVPRRAIKGVGEGAIEKINEAMAAFYETRAADRKKAAKEAAKAGATSVATGLDATVKVDAKRVYSPKELGTTIKELRDLYAMPALQQAKGECVPKVGSLMLAGARHVVVDLKEEGDHIDFTALPVAMNVVGEKRFAVDAMSTAPDKADRLLNVTVMIDGMPGRLGADKDAVRIRGTIEADPKPKKSKRSK